MRPILALLALPLTACLSQQPADVYPMPIDQVYKKLVNVDFGPMSDGEKALDTEKTAEGNGRDKVTWVHKGDMAYFKCKLGLSPWAEDAAQTHVTVSCTGGGAGDGAAAGLVRNMIRQRTIERVDATLTGRSFDAERAGATAYRWPKDTESVKTMAEGRAEIEETIRDLRTKARREQLDRAAYGGDPVYRN